MCYWFLVGGRDCIRKLNLYPYEIPFLISNGFSFSGKHSFSGITICVFIRFLRFIHFLRDRLDTRGCENRVTSFCIGN